MYVTIESMCIMIKFTYVMIKSTRVLIKSILIMMDSMLDPRLVIVSVCIMIDVDGCGHIIELN